MIFHLYFNLSAMTEYYAVCEYFPNYKTDDPSLTSEDVTAAIDLGELTDTELESLISLISKDYATKQIAEWIPEHHFDRVTIFPKHCIGSADISIKIRFDDLLEKYDKCDRKMNYVGTYAIPLELCKKYADQIRSHRNSKTPTPKKAKQKNSGSRREKKITVKIRLDAAALNNPTILSLTAKQLAMYLKSYDGMPCSESAIKKEPLWKEYQKDSKAAKNNRPESKTEYERAVLEHEQYEADLDEKLDSDTDNESSRK